ncbi:FeoB-associated Cys-rich membrane protein [Acidaminobacter sp. JC074]|uniref:FeoB-associated Cys-rich membrane protein n=1 Tax=Acidaminobacter sp. JC074 TaxID=2530199 RepID=UPI001F112FB7|nr:FeoB-associated Cys-rich membrane protein [Acidaminobacter sp. JC074]MCH4891022.1 FeoB-associated Cys-rich membrane protein [Acidaminobacter sp. JC074]
MANIIVSLIILGILGLSITKIVIEKRKGVRCIGCPHSGTVSKNNCSCDVVELELNKK